MGFLGVISKGEETGSAAISHVIISQAFAPLAALLMFMHVAGVIVSVVMVGGRISTPLNAYTVLKHTTHLSCGTL